MFSPIAFFLICWRETSMNPRKSLMKQHGKPNKLWKVRFTLLTNGGWIGFLAIETTLSWNRSKGSRFAVDLQCFSAPTLKQATPVWSLPVYLSLSPFILNSAAPLPCKLNAFHGLEPPVSFPLSSTSSKIGSVWEMQVGEDISATQWWILLNSWLKTT